MATYTANYGLHQWEPGDDFLRTDFNEDFQKIDAALGDMSGFVLGAYSGDSAAEQAITLDFQPSAVLVMDSSGLAASSSGSTPQVYGGLALWNKPVQVGSSRIALELTASGFTVYNYTDFDYIRINRSGRDYYFLAMR